MTCDNTDCEGGCDETIEKVLMAREFCASGEKEWVDWCEECQYRDKDMIVTEEEWENTGPVYDVYEFPINEENTELIDYYKQYDISWRYLLKKTGAWDDGAIQYRCLDDVYLECGKIIFEREQQKIFEKDGKYYFLNFFW